MQRSFVHVLLSLLLLVTQQMSLLHGFSHANEGRYAPGAITLEQAGPDSGGQIRKPTLHDLCSKCAASAQVAFALPTMARTFLPVELAYSQPGAPRTPALWLLARFAFQPRAPPSA